MFSLKGDVWSFGIFLWELISLARAPYSDIEFDQIQGHLQNGYRPAMPLGCPEALYALMARCWEFTPEARPSTREILATLEKVKHLQTNVF